MDMFSSAPVTFSIVIANLIASLIGFASKDFLEQNIFWIQPIKESHQWHRVLTSGFIHAAGWHLLINMSALITVGPALEMYWGSFDFCLLYFGSLLGGSLWMYFQKGTQPNYRALGASGAISGLATSLAIIAPFTPLLIMFVIPIWAVMFGALLILISIAFLKRENAIFAHAGHLGGGLAGIAVTILLKPESLGQLTQQITEKFG